MSDTIGIVGLGLMGSVLARRLDRRGLRCGGLRHRRGQDRGPRRVGRPRRGVDRRRRARGRPDHPRGVRHRPGGTGGGRADPRGAGRRLRQDRDVHLDLRSRPHRCARARASSPRAAVSRDAGVGHQRAGAARRRCRADRRRPGSRGAGRRRARRDLSGRFHVGRAGDGGRAKLAVNLILGLNRLALAEGLVFASRLGLDPQAFFEIARARRPIRR